MQNFARFSVCVFDSFLLLLGSQNRPKITQKACFFRDPFACRHFFMNFVFLMVFYMLFLGKTIVWTAQACTKHTLGKNRLFRSRSRFWSDFGLFWPPFGTQNAPNSPKKRDRKIITFLLDFLLIFGSILDPILAPKIRNAQKNLQKITKNQKWSLPGAWKGPRHHFGAILAYFSWFLSLFQ